MTATILVIEDNPITSKLVRFTLERERYRVVDAADGASGVERFVTERPTLVLLDLLLPDTDGFVLFQRLRALPRGSEVPILAFTGMVSQHDESRISEFGFDDVVHKPVEPSRLVQIVRGYLAPTETSRPTPVPDGPARKLVLADDDAVQRKLVALRLQRAGFEVTTAANGEEGLALARSIRPYAIVSDVLMPRLDGFGLCMAIRRDPALANTPVLLISNSYLGAEDRALAQRAGADDLLLRTPELLDVIELLRSDAIAQRPRRQPTRSTLDPAIDRERVERMMNQLERQVAMQAGLTQRCALLSAELAVLSGISEAVATEHDLEGALHQILASCFDAGGISLGVLYLVDDRGLRAVRFGTAGWDGDEVETFFGHRALLDQAIHTQSTVCVPSDTYPETGYSALLSRMQARSLLIAPLSYQGAPLGALVTMSRSLDTQPSDRVAFAQAVAGQISLALALARSFQAKDASERGARTNAAVLRSILDSMAEGVLVGGEDAEITHWNHAAVSILGFDNDPPSRLRLGDAHRDLARALRGEAVDHAEVKLPSADGSDPRWLSVNARPIDDEASGLRGAVAVFRDVTSERANSARLLVTERMASLGTLAAGVGHEINNPLMAVLGNLEMAMADLDAARATPGTPLDLSELAEVLGDARDAADRVRNIVRDLKLFSRSEIDTLAPVDVSRVLDSSLRMVANEIRHRATVIRDYQPVPAVHANETRLGQVFLNLIVNAAQAIPEGRTSINHIRVATSVNADGRVRVEITDTGSGMTPEVAAQIFTPFFTTKPIGMGTGLGLSICHQLVTSIGGGITVDTEPGVGTTFAVLLPADDAVIEAPSRPSQPIPVSEPRRILVVDDEPSVASLIARALAGHVVTTSTDAQEAARQIQHGLTYDLVLCDLMMPNFTGMDFFRVVELHAPALATRMIFMTGGAFTEQARKFVERTPNQCVDKPIDMQSLRRLVDRQLSALARGGE